jgi:beta-phosphoglucomutase-like phosphatase (HAD superfamily)
MNYKAVIFDLDGTIVNTEKIWAMATKVLIENHGVVYTDELKALLDTQIHGLALHHSCRIIKDVTGLAGHVEDLIKEKSHIALSLYRQGITFIEGFTNFHSEVVRYNLKHGIATNANDETVIMTDEKLNLKKFFGEHIYGISCVNNVHKPDPAIYLHVADKLASDPKHCIAVEDSAHGVRAAKRAGLYCIGITTAGRPEQLAEADIMVDSYAEINLKRLLFD